MRQKKAVFLGLFFIITIFSLVGFLTRTNYDVFAQIPTGSIPTVTGTPSGPVITVKSGIGEPSINVRSGPSVLYDQVGVLLEGQSAPAKGRSPGGEWILIEYAGAPGGTGWVYGANVNITPGTLPIVEPPPTVTPEVTQTIDPTLAAQFIVTAAPTRLPTFTQPAPLSIPTYQTGTESATASGVPMGLVILVLLTVGILFGIFSLVQKR